MRVLVVGAGAIGGYFGGRLLQAGRDVTFLVRARRRAELASARLIIKSSHGNVTIPKPATILAENLRQPFDLVLLSCKAYDLAGAMESFAGAVGPESVVLPLLNGMRHLEMLDDRFATSKILGGQCMIAVPLDAQRVVVHLNDNQELKFGERDGAISDRIRNVASTLGNAGFDATLSKNIVQEMWEKWVFLAALAGGTCLMRAPIGDIMASPGGEESVRLLLEECRAIAEKAGHLPRAEFLQQARTALTTAGSPLTSSMLRDVEANAPVEADHIVGDLLRRREPRPVLDAVDCIYPFKGLRSTTCESACAFVHAASRQFLGSPAYDAGVPARMNHRRTHRGLSRFSIGALRESGARLG